MNPAGDDLGRKTARLREMLRESGPILVAFSGGVDSAVLLAVARQVLGDGATGVLAVSPSLPRSELLDARRIAGEIGAPLLEVATRETDDPRYRRNAPDRCFFCKDALFAAMERLALERGARTIAYGAIVDDAGDFRPGMDAARERRARAPLLEAGLGKAEVREVARRLGLTVWDKPARACLASRIPHGTEVTPERLRRVEEAEEALRSAGFTQYRVRDHGDVARIEVGAAEIGRMADPAIRATVAAAIRGTGFRWVALDLEGYRAGGLNAIRRPRPGSPAADAGGG